MFNPSPFTFGTARADDPSEKSHVSLVREAVDRGAWLHTAATYGRSLEVIAKAVKGRTSPHVIAKLRSHDPADLRAEFEQTRRRAKLERIDAIQLAASPDPALFEEGHPYRAELDRLRADGLIDAVLLEMFWERSAALHDVALDDVIDGVVCYVNLFNRELSNDLHAALLAAGKSIVALRPHCGGRFGDEPRTVRERGKKQERDGRHDSKFDQIDSLAYENDAASLGAMSMRYLRAAPGIATIVGSTRREDRLVHALDTCERKRPVETELVERIDALHRTWWSHSGAGYEPNESSELPDDPSRRGLGGKLRKLFGG